LYSNVPEGYPNLEGRIKRVRIRKEVETTMKILNLMQMLEGPRRRRRR
jgi:hypothetical protein